MGNKLHTPAKSGKVQEFRKLLEDNPKLDPNNRNKSGNTPLHKAAQYGNIEVAELILSHRANVDVNVPNGDNYSPLHIASMKGQTAMVQFLFDKGAKLDALGGAWDSTPLHWACINDHIETAKLLIKLGADKDIKDGVQRTPFDYLKSEYARNELASGEEPVWVSDLNEKFLAEEKKKEDEAAEQRRKMLQGVNLSSLNLEQLANGWEMLFHRSEEAEEDDSNVETDKLLKECIEKLGSNEALGDIHCEILERAAINIILDIVQPVDRYYSDRGPLIEAASKFLTARIVKDMRGSAESVYLGDYTKGWWSPVCDIIAELSDYSTQSDDIHTSVKIAQISIFEKKSSSCYYLKPFHLCVY